MTSLRGPVPHRVADSDLLLFYYVQSIILYISLFFTGQWTFCSLPFQVQFLLCFLAHCPCSAAHCRSCLLLCRAEGNRTPLPMFYESVVHCIIFGQEVEISFSTLSLQLDLMIKRLRKNTRTLPDILACVGLSSWGSHKALGSFTDTLLGKYFSPSNSLISISDPWRAFWADKAAFNRPRLASCVASGTTDTRTARCVAIGAEVQGHRQQQRTQTLILR